MENEQNQKIQTEPVAEQNPVVSTPPERKKSHVPKVLLVALVFLAVLVIAGSSYYLGSHKSNSMNKQSVQTKVSTPSPTLDPTADWKTYNFPNSNISFKYPADWKIEEGLQYTPQSVSVNK